MFEQANRSTTASVSERKSALESLVTTIDLRTTDLDQRLSRFTGLLDESLGAAEERARDIARVVAETETHTSGCCLRNAASTVPLPTAVGPVNTMRRPPVRSC